ncbi:MAG TPA: hypothetical protein VHC98_02840 [Candidatus Saccharimonadales bacterium]|nr:hypothetical protein [Candidatus Saccharimonadales bacterium]
MSHNQQPLPVSPSFTFAPEVPEAMQHFYKGEFMALPIVTPSGERGFASETLRLPSAVPDEAAVVDALRRMEFRIVTNSTSDKGNTTFEAATFNNDPNTQATVAFVSTYSSSISGNKGNAWELATMAAMFPDVTFIYLASAGNGKTGALKPAEMRHLIATGLLTHTEKGNVEAVPTMQNAAGALLSLGREPSALAGNSAGCEQSRAIGIALPEDTISRAVFNADPHMTATTPLQLAWRALITEGMRTGATLRRQTHDPLAVTPAHVDTVTTERQDIYGDSAGTAAEKLGTMAMLAANMFGLAHGGTVLKREVEAFLQRQPNAVMTFYVPLRDRLHDRTKLYPHARQLAGTLPAGSKVIAVPEATHAYNTPNPLAFYTMIGRALALQTS